MLERRNQPDPNADCYNYIGMWPGSVIRIQPAVFCLRVLLCNDTRSQ